MLRKSRNARHAGAILAACLLTLEIAVRQIASVCRRAR